MIFLISENAGKVSAFGICPTFYFDGNRQWLDIQDRESLISTVKDIMVSFETCPTVLKDKTIKIGLTGTNPFLYNDEKKRVIYNADGFPMGSNGGIAAEFAKRFGYNVNITVYTSNPIYNTTTGKGSGYIVDVSNALLLSK